MAEAEAAVAAAEAVLADAEGELAVRQRAVAAYAAAIYRDGGAITPLTLLLSAGDPGEVLAAMGFLDVVEAHAAEVIGVGGGAAPGRPERSGGRPRPHWRRPVRAADEVAGEVAELEAAASAVTDELDAALGEVDRQLAELQKEQVDVNIRTAANWQVYVDGLAAAGVVAPPAAALRNSPAGLPEGMAAVAASDGSAQRGAAQLPRQPSSLLVLPAETVAAVTAAMGAAGAAVRARDRGAGVVGVRIARAVGVRVRRDRAAGGPGRSLRRHHARRAGRRAARRPGVPRLGRVGARARRHRPGPQDDAGRRRAGGRGRRPHPARRPGAGRRTAEPG